MCAIFFRKKEEIFDDELLEEERITLLQSLPVNIALSVYYYLDYSHEKENFVIETKSN